LAAGEEKGIDAKSIDVRKAVMAMTIRR